MKKIVDFIVYNKAATYVAALFCIALWGVSLNTTSSLLIPYVTCTVYLVAGFFLMRTNERIVYSTADKTSLTGTLFLMSCALAPSLATSITVMSHFILLSSALSLLLRTYRQPDSMGIYFTAFVLVGIISLTYPTILFVTPLLLICCLLLQSLHIRTILASIFGLLLPYWGAICVLFITEKSFPIDAYVEHLLSPTIVLQQEPITFINGYTFPAEAPQILWFFLLIMPGISATFFSRITLKARTQASLYFLTTAVLLMLALIAIFPAFYTTMLPLLYLAASISSTVFFINGSHRWSRTYLIVITAAWLLMTIISIWNNCPTY